MLTNLVYHKQLPFRAVLMDTWYATRDLMLFIESLHKIYYCPLKDNRQVDDSGDTCPYQRVDELTWSEHERQHGKQIKIKGFPKDHKVQCFRVEVSTHRTDWIVTNDPAQDSTEATREVCGFRWKSSNCIGKGNKSPVWNDANAAKLVSNAIISAALCWSGLDLKTWRLKPSAPFITQARLT